jgi:hypothetical protein
MRTRAFRVPYLQTKDQPPMLQQPVPGYLLQEFFEDTNLSRDCLREVVNVSNMNGRSLLEWDMVLFDGAHIQDLLAHGADPNFVGTCGQTMLGLAINLNRPEVLELLCAARADVNQRYCGRDDSTPLRMILESGASKVYESVDVLLEWGVDARRVRAEQPWNHFIRWRLFFAKLDARTNRCKAACIVLIWKRLIGRDVSVLVAKYLWATRQRKVWI